MGDFSSSATDNEDDDGEHEDNCQEAIGNAGVDHKMDIHIDPSQSNNILKCSECDYKCEYENILREHMEIHTGEGPFLCSECGEQSSTMQDMVKHMLIHTGEKSSTQDEHGLTNEGDILMSCTICDFSCLNNDILRNHLISHNVYSCMKCDFIGKSAKILANHTKSHEKENSFICSQCDYTATSAGELNIHMTKHTGEKFTNKPCSNILKSPLIKSTPMTSNTGKRYLSVSPEDINTNKKDLRSNNSKRNKSFKK